MSPSPHPSGDTFVIELLVTGDVEEHAIAPSLTPLFPDDDRHFFIRFRTLFAGSRTRGERSGAFTTERLPAPPAKPPTSGPGKAKADRLARMLVNAVLVQRRPGAPVADFAIALEDLELANADQPDVVCAHFRQAVRAVLDERPEATRAADELAVRERCSFHLLAPMVEAYFFGDPAALTRAGARADVPNRFEGATADVESFVVEDPRYTQSVATWSRSPRQPARHPKHYLSYLCGGERAYREGRDGVSALTGLSYSAVLFYRHRTRFLRSLIADLHDIAGRTQPFAGDTHPQTWGASGLLRNL